MPPQRRKIVPPNTTNKARKKVAGSNRPAQTADAEDVVTPAVDEQQSTVENTSLEKAPAGNASAGKAPAEKAPAEKAPAEKVRAEKAPAEKVSLGKSAAAEKAPAEKVSLGTSDAGAASTEPVTPSDSAARANWTPVLVVGAVAVVLAVFAVVAAFRPGADIDNKAWVDQGATSEVTRAATDAVVTLYSYKDTTIDEDFDKARSYLNTQMLSDFDAAAETTKSAVQQTQTATEASLTDIGVTRLEDDKAELVANLNVSATQGGVAQGNAEGPITVNLEKVDGKWLLSALSDQ